MADHAEDKDVPMEDVDVDLESDDKAKDTKEDSEEKTTDEAKKEEADVDSDAASELEFDAEDDRTGQSDGEEDSWRWHVELYPISPEDVILDNFMKLVTTAEHSNVVFRTVENEEKKGEAHFYMNDDQVAKIVMRTICCRKFSVIRPFVYLYFKHEDGETETAALRLDLIEAAKMRWDRQRKNLGDPSMRVAKVSGVPLDTTKEFLNIVFARAFHIKRESDESEEAAKKASEAEDKDKDTSSEQDKDDEDESNEEDEELVGEFNGNLTIDCVSRTSLKGFLLGYRRVTIGGSQLSLQALAEDEFNMADLRKEMRKRRAEAEAAKTKTVKTENGKSPNRGGARGGGRGARGARGSPARGGRGDYRGSGRGGGVMSGRGSGMMTGRGGGIMTGRQKMEEKMRRGGGREMRGGGRGIYPGGREMRGRGMAGGRDMGGRGRDLGGWDMRGGGYLDDMQYQMDMNTYRLERQMISMPGRGRSPGLLSTGLRDYARDPYARDPYARDYDVPHFSPRSFSDYGVRDDWVGIRNGPAGRGMGMGRNLRSLRDRRL